MRPQGEGRTGNLSQVVGEMGGSCGEVRGLRGAVGPREEVGVGGGE